MSVQLCEGVWRNRSGQRLVITQCNPGDDGQQWTDGDQRYSDDGSFYGRYSGCSDQDLVEYIGPFPYRSQRAPVSRPAETESTTAVAGGVSDNPGWIIYNLEKKLEAANATISNQSAEIERLKPERQRDFTTAQQLRAENESLAVRLQRAEVAAAEALQRWETTEQVCLRIITALAGVRS